MKKYLTKPGRIILFIILPCIFLLLSMLLKSEMGYYHLFTTDPEYAYLVNGLNICNFRPPSQVQGPGTPSQFFAAVLIEMVHAFRQQGTLIEDVMQNPDVYISAFHASLTAITAILILILGLTLSKLTKNIYIGLFVQIIPFTSWQILDLMRRYMVENMIIAGMLMLFIFLFLFIYTEDLSVKRIRLYTVIFSICIGFIAATKLMYLPVAIIPFMILPGYRYKIYYFIFSILAFSLFAFPIFFSWHTFWDWHVQNFLHAGQYGSGAATVIDPYQFAKNLKTVLIYDGTFRYIFLILFIGVLVYQIPAIKVKRESDKEYYALAGIVICMTIMTFLVSKQLKYYYMITAILLEVPGIILLFKIFARSPFKNIVVPITFILSGLFIFKFYQETLTNISVHDRYMQRKENYMEAFHYANTELKGKPTLLIADYYGAPYKEYGIFFGISWGGLNNKIRYAPTLNKLYPNVYIYHGWNTLFNQWEREDSYIGLLKKYKKIILYVGDENLEKSLDFMLKGFNRQLDVSREKIKSFPEARATFYSVSLDSVKNVRPYVLNFDAETLDSTRNYFLSKEGVTAQNGSTQSDEFAHSGRYSAKLVKDNPYGLTCNLGEVQNGEHYIITVWRYNNGNEKAGLVIMNYTADRYYNIISKAVLEENGWQKIECDLFITEKLNNLDMKIYVWNMEENLPAYFDDLEIERK